MNKKIYLDKSLNLVFVIRRNINAPVTQLLYDYTNK